MANSNDVTMRFRADISDLKRGITDANNQIKLANAQFKAATAGMDDWSKSADGIRAKLAQLDSVIQAQKAKVEAYREQLKRQEEASKTNGERANALREQMQKLAADGVDKTSKEYRLLEQQLASVEKEQESNAKSVNNLKIQVLDAEAAVAKSEKEYSQYSDALRDVGEESDRDAKETKDLADETKKAGKSAEDAKSGFTVLKGALASLAADGIKACARGLKELGRGFVDTIQDVADAGDEIQKNSQKVGLSYESYQKWDYAMKIAGTEMASMNTGLKTLTNKFDDALTGSKGAVEQFNRLGLSMSDIKDLSREELFGTVIESLQGVTDETEKAALANDFFGKSGQELIPLLNQSAEATQAILDEAEEYGMVLSNDAVEASASFKDSLTLMSGALTAVKNNIVAEFLPAATDMMKGFAGVIAGTEGAEEELQNGTQGFVKQLSGALPKVVILAKSIASAVLSVLPELTQTLLPELIQTVVDLIPELTQAVVQILPTAISSIVSALPLLISAGVKVLTELIKGLTRFLPDILTDFVQNQLPAIIEAILEVLPDLVTVLSEFAEALFTQAFPKIIISLADYLPELITTIIQFLIDNIPVLLQNGIKFWLAWIQAIPKVYGKLIKALLDTIALIADKFLRPLLDKFSEAWENIKNVFSNIGEWFGAKWEEVKQIFAKVGSWFGEKFGEAWTNIKAKFSKFGEFFSGLWNTVKTTFSALGTKIGDAISGAVKAGINGILTRIENIINNAIGLINGAIGLINKIPGVNLGTIAKVSFPRLEKGGVLEKGQVGFLEGSGAEAVVPLENNKKWIAAVAAAMSSEMGRSAVNNDYNFTQNIYSPKPLNRYEIYRQTRNQLNFAKMKAGV